MRPRSLRRFRGAPLHLRRVRELRRNESHTPPHERRRLPRCAGLQAPTTGLKHRPRPWSHCALHTAARHNGGASHCGLWPQESAAVLGCSGVSCRRPPPQGPSALANTRRDAVRHAHSATRLGPGLSALAVATCVAPPRTVKPPVGDRKNPTRSTGPTALDPLRRRPPGLCLRPPGGARAATVVRLVCATAAGRCLVRLVCASAAGRCVQRQSSAWSVLRPPGGARAATQGWGPAEGGGTLPPQKADAYPPCRLAASVAGVKTEPGL